MGTKGSSLVGDFFLGWGGVHDILLPMLTRKFLAVPLAGVRAGVGWGKAATMRSGVKPRCCGELA